MIAHLQRHAIGYLTILGAVINVLLEKLEVSWPVTRQDWTLLALNTCAAFIAAAIAYRANPNGLPPPVYTPIIPQP